MSKKGTSENHACASLADQSVDVSVLSGVPKKHVTNIILVVTDCYVVFF